MSKIHVKSQMRSSNENAFELFHRHYDEHGVLYEERLASIIRIGPEKLKALHEQNPCLVSYNVEFAEVTGGTFWKAYTPGQIAGTEPFLIESDEGSIMSTMFFSGGMIPKYLLVSRLRMTNTIWAVILPSCISVYNLIVARTFMAHSIPRELFDAAMVDGCSDFGYFLRVVLPLSKSIIAVLVLFFGVSRWNAYFEPMLYLTKRSLYPLSLIVREYLILSKFDASNIADPEKATKINEIMGGMKYALIVISTVPVMVLYPFVQKHFAKGVMIGSVKG